jgi:hypothetical protein
MPNHQLHSKTRYSTCHGILLTNGLVYIQILERPFDLEPQQLIYALSTKSQNFPCLSKTLSSPNLVRDYNFLASKLCVTLSSGEEAKLFAEKKSRGNLIISWTLGKRK